jgi:glucokinase
VSTHYGLPSVERGSRLYVAALDLFITNLGAKAGNLALVVLATGGVYIADGMAQRLLPAAGSWLFLSEFHDMGRLSPLMARIRSTLSWVTLLGAAITESAGSVTA